MNNSDVYDQSSYDVRCEWGLRGVETLAEKSDVIIIVDTLAFSTCVDVAVSHGAIIFPYRLKDGSAATYAQSLGAALAVPREAGGYSLSPASFMHVAIGTRVVLPSPNGATLSLATGGKPTIAGCLRNARSVARAAMKIGKHVAVMPAGEHWHDDTMRPAIEDMLGAGAIIHSLQGSYSPEALAARAIFAQFQNSLSETLHGCVSGRELIARGYETDVEFAAAYNSSDAIPMLKDGAYINAANDFR
jgi:2-phosphosulfolactate phosphatase